MPPAYRSQIFAPLGLVAAMCDARGIGEVMERATRHQPETRSVTTGDAVKAMVLNGLGVGNPPLSVGPRLFQDTPLSRRLPPLLIDAPPRHDAARGRALDTLKAYDVTALSGRLAATAAARLGLAARVAPLESTSVHVEGPDHRGQEPAEQGVQSTRGVGRRRSRWRRALHRWRYRAPGDAHRLSAAPPAPPAGPGDLGATLASHVPPASGPAPWIARWPAGGPGAFPAQVISLIDGALASSIAARQPLVNQWNQTFVPFSSSVRNVGSR